MIPRGCETRLPAKSNWRKFLRGQGIHQRFPQKSENRVTSIAIFGEFPKIAMVFATGVLVIEFACFFSFFSLG